MIEFILRLGAITLDKSMFSKRIKKDNKKKGCTDDISESDKKILLNLGIIGFKI